MGGGDTVFAYAIIFTGTPIYAIFEQFFFSFFFADFQPLVYCCFVFKGIE